MVAGIDNRIVQSTGAYDNVNGEQNNPALKKEETAILNKYKAACERWKTTSSYSVHEDLQAVKIDGERTFVQSSMKQKVASFFAPLVNLFRSFSNLFTQGLAKKGAYALIEQQTSEDFHKSIEAIFKYNSGVIPKNVLKVMGSHKNGKSWYPLTGLDIKNVMGAVKAQIGLLKNTNLMSEIEKYEKTAEEKFERGKVFEDLLSRDEIKSYKEVEKPLFNLPKTGNFG